MEKQYVDDGFPTDFPVVAPFLADIDTSNGHGQIFYRVTETPSVLNRVAQVKKQKWRLWLSSLTKPVVNNCVWFLFISSFISSSHSTLPYCSVHSSFPSLIRSFIHLLIQEVHRGFPDARFTPTHAVVATWENVASYEDDQKKRPSDKVTQILYAHTDR